MATGNVSLYWLGQMGLLIETGNTKICIDYFVSPLEGRQTLPPLPDDKLTDVDFFIGTHDHIDHIDHEAWEKWAKANPDAKFIFPRAHMNSILRDGISQDNAVGLNDGESYIFKDITIHAIAASHEFLDRDKTTGLYPYLQYVIETNGVKIHHAGDTLRYEGMLAKIKAFGDIDVQLLPINGRDAVRYNMGFLGNMTYQEAADLAGEVVPKLVIPGHWDMFKINGEDPALFADYLDAKFNGKIKCVIPEAMKKIVI